MSTANKLTYLNDTKGLLKQKINNLGGDITDNTTFRQYADKLQTIYDNAPKTDYEEGSNITLSNCLKGKLDYEDDKVGYGDTTQAIIPSEYQQVEYIESTGPAYIDTGFIPNTNTKIDIEFETIQKGTNGVIFGGETTYNSNCFHLYNTSGNFDIGFGSKNTGFATSVPYDLNTKYKFIMDKNGFDINGTTGTFPTPTISTTISIFLFAVHRGTSSNVIDSNAQKRIYYCKLYDNGTLVRNMIPCYRISDNVIGMYDIVNNTFYTNAGTGTFTKGNNAPTPTTPIPIQVVTGTQEVTIRGNNLLNFNVTQNSKVTVNTDGTITINGSGGFSLNFEAITLNANTSYSLKYEVVSGSVTGPNIFLSFNGSTWLTPTYPSTTYTPTSDETKNTIWINNSASFDNCKLKIWANEGSTALPFEPYITPITKTLNLGNLEFAEIGTYRDDIWTDRETKKWYKKANIGKYQFTGNDINYLHSSNATNNCYQYRTLVGFLSDLQVSPDPFNLNDTAYCNYAIKNGDISNLNNYHFTVNGNKQFCINTPQSTLENMRAWVNSVDLILYYQLATATDTEITDTTLISQLEEIYNIMSNNGTTIIEINGTLPMIIKCRALKGE